jgi:hypothetical protein
VTLGADYELPDTLWNGETPSTTKTSRTSTDPTPDAGKPIDGGGIPCVN